MRLVPRPLTRRAQLVTCAGLAVLLAAVIAVATSLGASGTGWRDLLRAPAELAPATRAILFEVRLPRVLLAAGLGGALALAGAVFQALLRNPLADPYVLGVAGGASLGGVVALLTGVGVVAGGLAGFAVAAASFVGALVTLVALQAVAGRGGRLSLPTLLLAGAIFNAFAGAVLVLVQSLVEPADLQAIVFYLLGRIPSLDAGPLAAVLGTIALLALLLARQGREFNALALGEEGARALGVEVERLRRRAVVVGSLLTGLAVALAGMIGFVGLVVPHALRLLFGPDHRLLLPASVLGGASFLVAADLVARLALAPAELPIGAVTALAGAPLFLVLLRQRPPHGDGR